MDVEIWSDVACPWCYIGKRRFETALSEFEHRDQVTVTWRSFELDPEAPAERLGDRAERLASKYGITVEVAREKEAELTEMAAAEGLSFRFDIARSGATFDAHRVVHLGAERGLQDDVKERLLRAYFTEGELVGDHETLVRLGSEAGLDPEEVRAALVDEHYDELVRDDERSAATLGIAAVPTFIVDRRIGVSGAQPPEVLLSLLEQAWFKRDGAPTVSPAGA